MPTTPYATIADLERALLRAVQQTLGEADPTREARMADVGSVMLAITTRLNTLTFVDGSRRRSDTT